MTELSERIYSSRSQLCTPIKMLRSMIADLIACRELAWRLFVRNIRAQYRQTFFGYAWLLLPPIFTTIIWVYLNKTKILSVGETSIPYPVYVLVGTLLWQSFVKSVSHPIQQVQQNKSVISKLNFPKEAIILSSFGEMLFNCIVQLLVLIPVFIWFKIPVSTAVVLAPVGILAMLGAGTTLGQLLLPLGSLYKDVTKGLPLVLRAWFFLTPIVYPKPESGFPALLANINPVTPLVDTTRAWLTGGDAGSVLPFFAVAVIILLLFLVGWIMMRLSMPPIIERMNA